MAIARGRRGKRLLRQRGERLERPFAHLDRTGRLRRVSVRGRQNIRKRVIVHVAASNLGLLMRTRFGVGTPRSLQGLAVAVCALMLTLWTALKRFWSPFRPLHVLDPLCDHAASAMQS